MLALDARPHGSSGGAFAGADLASGRATLTSTCTPSLSTRVVTYS